MGAAAQVLYGLWSKGSGVDVETCLEMILAYVEGAILRWRVYLQGPEADMSLGAVFHTFGPKLALFDLSACLTGSRCQNTT